jgi:hypothetical protein
MVTTADLIDELPKVADPADTPDDGWAYWPENSLLLRRASGGTVIGVTHYLFTWGVLRGVDHLGYRERWCYESLPLAVMAASILTDEGEPVIPFIRKATG